RLGRSITDLIKLVSDLSDRGIQFRSLTEAIDTATPGGELVFRIFAALAQMERRLLSERTRAGLAAARARGHVGGRPTVMTVEKLEAARVMHANGATYTVISTALGIGRSTVAEHWRNRPDTRFRPRVPMRSKRVAHGFERRFRSRRPGMSDRDAARRQLLGFDPFRGLRVAMRAGCSINRVQRSSTSRHPYQ
ncbi:MAG: recombinase family protein, partial [Candidatus Nanopelagicales bacterium]